MQKIYEYITTDQFIRNNAIYFIGSGVVAVLNYLYHPIIGRLLSVTEFGEVQALFSLLMLTSIILSAAGMVTVSLITRSTDDVDLQGTLKRWYSVIFYVVTGVVILLLLATPLIKEKLKFESYLPLWIFLITILLSIPVSMGNFMLQGKRQFFKLSISSILASSSKLIFSVLFVLIGWKVFGAIAGLTASSIVAISYLYSRIHKNFNIIPGTKLSYTESKDDIWHAVFVVLVLGFVTFLTSFDVLLIKYFFSPQVAGEYSGVATIARIIYFATGSTAGVLLSSITLNKSLKENSRHLFKAMTITTLIGGGILLLFYFFPEQVIRLFIGEKYTPLSSVLPTLGVMLFLVSLINTFLVYFISLKKYEVIPVVVSGVGIILYVVWRYHATVLNVVQVFTYVSALLLGMLILLYIYNYFTEKEYGQA